jgi:hypothetical protein
VAQKMTKKEGHNVSDYVFFKRMYFKGKVSQILIKKRDRSLRVLRNVFHVLSMTRNLFPIQSS